MTVVSRPGAPHRCQIASGVYVGAINAVGDRTRPDYPVGTIVRCDGCGQMYRVTAAPLGYDGYPVAASFVLRAISDRRARRLIRRGKAPTR